MPIVPAEIEDYCRAHTSAPPPLLAELQTWTREHEEMHRMLTGRLEGRLLKMLVQLSGARRAVELGTFTGYSALSIAEGLPEDGRLITCELSPERAARVREWLARSPHGHKVEVRAGPALETLAALAGPFDFAFIDADKPNYPRYLELLLERMPSGALLAFDNALWGGDVLQADAPEATESTRAITELNRRLAQDDRVESVLLTVRDGLHLARVR